MQNDNVGSSSIKIEAGQILNPDHFPPPNELVCIEVPKVFDQVALRDCITRNIALIPGSGVINPTFSYEGAINFNIQDIRVVSKTDSLTKPKFKKLKLFVRIGYTVVYSDGVNQNLTLDDVSAFNLTINEIYCPDSLTQIGLIRYPEYPSRIVDIDGTSLKVEAIADAFNDTINTTTGVLSLDIGVFFVIKCECVVQLLIPSFGYCPVPPEQQNAATQNCSTFNNRALTPFPTQFFPDQKWNPLDSARKDNWD
ncbi:MAG: hypothetical protein QHH06_14670 [Clostridiales bacterium]|nr:hypothetical protein [Eubacteriales bacterium]MDH7567683.1 hypothetical protein [Clostridiales bacterium]